MTRSLTIPSTINRPDLFIVNTDSKSISSYSIASDGTLTLLETTPVNAPTPLPPDSPTPGPAGAQPIGIVVT
jgi:hypothetical protein